ncbi:MAG: hypothetical protein BHV87_15455 [Clostridiales bacterium 36_14]|nr:MAG: hypothetical protein BHV87_15455 [Clostridiales bacterium 36_14]
MRDKIRAKKFCREDTSKINISIPPQKIKKTYTLLLDKPNNVQTLFYILILLVAYFYISPPNFSFLSITFLYGKSKCINLFYSDPLVLIANEYTSLDQTEIQAIDNTILYILLKKNFQFICNFLL